MEWINDAKLVLTAVGYPYRKTRAVKTVRFLGVPEVASRAATFESGQAILRCVSIPNTQWSVDAGGVARE